MKYHLGIVFSLLSTSFTFALSTTTGLETIGMPLGGLFTGGVYLSGDGELWNWDIFNIKKYASGGGGDAHYLHPLRKGAEASLCSFHLRLRTEEGVQRIPLNAQGFSQIRFEGQYPVARVQYRDDQLPLQVSLQAFSPFIPCDVDASSLPAIYMEYSLYNSSPHEIELEVCAQLDNKVCFYSATKNRDQGQHVNTLTQREDMTRLDCAAQGCDMSLYPDGGTMSLAYMGQGAEGHTPATAPLGEPLRGELSKKIKLAAGESTSCIFLITWDFPNLHLWNNGGQWATSPNFRHYYSRDREHSAELVDYLIAHPELRDLSLKWNKVWYDSTLPPVLLDRSFANVSTLATPACVRIDDLDNQPEQEGRMYNDEGVYYGPGTCRHVSHYGQAMGRLFPSLARHRRLVVDLGYALSEEGVIGYRGESSAFGHHDGRGYACDGQAGSILAVYREHLMAPNDDFLESIWPQVKKAMQYMIDHDAQDGHRDGILEGAQYNTLDRIWYGKIPWISGLYIAALKASAQMAEEQGESSFARTCTHLAQNGGRQLVSQLFNGQYFIQEIDPEHRDAPNSNIGCHIDQLLGQYWAHQLGLGDIVPKEYRDKALSALLENNFVRHYGQFLKESKIPVARYYAQEEEEGMVMCSFPQGGEEQASNQAQDDWQRLVVGYFSEMWTGQEHALAALLWDENRVPDALRVMQAVHQRYAPEKRNPYNEIEYGNHYTRAMSSYATYISATGFRYHGPQGRLGFAPKWQPQDFRCAFVSAEAWGSYAQKISSKEQAYSLHVEYGTLSLREWLLPQSVSPDAPWVIASLRLNNESLQAELKEGVLHLPPCQLKQGDKLELLLDRSAPLPRGE